MLPAQQFVPHDIAEHRLRGAVTGVGFARLRGARLLQFAHRFGELFTDAVKLRLRADVEVGSCLSGGLDSSALVTTAAKLAAKAAKPKKEKVEKDKTEPATA